MKIIFLCIFFVFFSTVPMSLFAQEQMPLSPLRIEQFTERLENNYTGDIEDFLLKNDNYQFSIDTRTAIEHLNGKNDFQFSPFVTSPNSQSSIVELWKNDNKDYADLSLLLEEMENQIEINKDEFSYIFKEIEPGEAAGVILKNIKINQEFAGGCTNSPCNNSNNNNVFVKDFSENQKLVTQLKSTIEVTRQKQCGNSIRSLRSRFNFAPFGKVSKLNNFFLYCLSSKPSGKKISFSTAEEKNLNNCSKTYFNIAKHCYSSKSTSSILHEKANQFVGILIYKSKQVYKEKIICSATIVANKHLITAAHCLEEIIKSPINEQGKLIFIPRSSEFKKTSYQVSHAYISPSFVRTVITDNESIENLINGMTGDDIALLEVKEAIGAIILKKPILSPLRCNNTGCRIIKRIALTSYQTMISRATKLASAIDQKIIPSDRILLKSEYWKNSVVTDETPTCTLLSLPDKNGRENLYGHMCQSLIGSSGGAIWDYDSDPEKLILLGVHLGADSQYIPGVIVEKNQPRNLVAGLPDKLINLINEINSGL